MVTLTTVGRTPHAIRHLLRAVEQAPKRCDSLSSRFLPAVNARGLPLWLNPAACLSARRSHHSFAPIWILSSLPVQRCDYAWLQGHSYLHRGYARSMSFIPGHFLNSLSVRTTRERRPHPFSYPRLYALLPGGPPRSIPPCVACAFCCVAIHL